MDSLQSTPLSPLAERYRRSRQLKRGSAPGLDRFLARCPDLNAAQLVEVLLVDQALEWQQEPGTSVEEYLRRFPTLAGQEQVVLDLVYGEMRAVGALDLPIDVESYALRFPDLAKPLRRQLEVSTWLAGTDAHGRPADSPQG